MKTLIIIPAYNEEESILNTVKTLKAINKKVDYIVINDGSTDKTREICIKNKLNFVDLPNNLGIGGAVQTGYIYALENDYDIAIQFDGDGQHDAHYLNDLIKEIESGADMAIGSRFVKKSEGFQSSFIRRVGLNILSVIIKICTGQKICDPTSGFRACNREIIKIFSDEYPIDYPEPDTIVRLIKMGYKVKEVPVTMNERKGGKSSINALRAIYYMIKVSISIVMAALNTKKVK